MKYLIVSIDGGGIRGIISAALIERIERVIPFLKNVSFFCGTSTGGLIALAAAKGLSPSFIKNVYIKKGEKIFADSWLDDLKDMLGFTGADYDIENLDGTLHEIFGDETLSSLQKKVLVTAFDLDNEQHSRLKRRWNVKYFSNLIHSGSAEMGMPSNGIYDFNPETPIYKAALYTAAAPTYFPSVDGYVDGGIFAGNPSMVALCAVMGCKKDLKLSDVYLLSIGTGTGLHYIEGKDLDWGVYQWLKPLVNMIMDGQNASVDVQCRDLLGERYFRLAPEFPAGVDIGMDDYKSIPWMLKFAGEFDLSSALVWIKNSVNLEAV